MDLEREVPGLEFGVDDEIISTISGSDKLGSGDETKVQNNGCVVENIYPNELSSEGTGMGTEVRGLVNLADADVKPEVSPSPATTKKGNRLKKWKRIKRDPNKVGNSSVDTVTRDLSTSGANSSKRMQVFEDRNQRGEGSVSSTNARNLDGFAMLGDYRLSIGPTFAAGTNSENSEDRSSKFSTAASVTRARYEMPVVAGFPRDKSRMRSLSGKNLGILVRGQQGWGRIETSKKAEGECVKIEKENSHSSMESDSRSSNFVLMQGNDSATSNGIPSGKSMNCDEENGDEVQAGEREVSDGLRGGYDRNSGEGFEDVSREDLVANSSWEAKEERSGNHVNSTYCNPLVESIFALQSAQEAFEKEVQKFREIGRADVSVDDVIQDLPSEFASVDPKLYETSSSEQILRVAAVDHITLVEDQNTRALQQSRMLNELEDTEDVKNAAVDSEDIPSADETLKMQKRVSGNQNPPGGGPFDMLKLFKPSTPSPPNSTTTANPNPQNPHNNNNNINTSTINPNLISSPFPLPLASYPPPTGGVSGAGTYSYSPQNSPFQYFSHLPMYSTPNPTPPHPDFANMHPQRSLSYPTPTLQPQVQPPTSPHQQNFQNPPNSQNSNNHGPRLMALLSAPPSTLDVPQQPVMPMPQIHPTSSAGSDFSIPQNAPNLGIPHQGAMMRMPSSKLPKGRHLIGDHIVYDIDVRLPGEVQPQLEVTPITKYGSDPGLVVGRQIAVNKSYICYGLKLGAIRVLNINTALRSLLKGLSQRVTDMAFFAQDVHLLASASVDGRVYVWKITEDPDEEDKPQITGNIVIAIQITGEWESVHPRVCWHCHKQEVLVVGIGRHVLKIDTTKVGKGEVFSAEKPLKCPIDKLIHGIQLVGSHDGEVTDLSMSQWMTTRLVSASLDGTIKIWEDRKSLPIAVLRPHDSQPVNSVTFLAAPNRPDHIILITGGPLNRELKIWASASEEGWLLPSEAESWCCTQTLELKSSAEAQVEEAFFNQVVALSHAGLLLLANAKRNAIYAVHLEYGPNPASTRMDYIAEFTVTMPILSFTGTSELLPHGEQIVQVYCVQTQAIQQYALDLSQCLPPPMDNLVFEKLDSSISHDAATIEGLTNYGPSGSKSTETHLSSSTTKPSEPESGSESASPARYLFNAASAESPTLQEFSTSNMETKPVPLSVVTHNPSVASVASPPPPLSPKLSRELSGFRSPSSSFEPVPVGNDHDADPKVVEHSVDRQMDAVHANSSGATLMDGDSINDENKLSQDDISTSLDHQSKFKHPTHLITPSEILMASSSSDMNRANEPKNDPELNIQDVVISNDTRNVEVDVKVVGDGQNNDIGLQELHNFGSKNKEKSFYSQASDLGIDITRDCQTLPDTCIVEETRRLDGIGGSESVTQPSTLDEEDSTKELSRKVIDSSIPMPVQQPPAPSTKGKKHKGKSAQGSSPSSPSPSAFNSRDSSNEPGVSLSNPHVETAFAQVLSMQEMLNQLVATQKEMQKQMTGMVAVPVTKEGRRLESALGRRMEKAVEANADALWAQFQEEISKQEKASWDCTQQLTDMVNNCLNRDLSSIVEKTVKKELTAVGQAVARTIIPSLEKTASTSITEAFQKGVSDKAVNQLEKSVSSKLEATVARQIQTQFQTSGKQALQETLKSSLEASVVPAFEMSCRAMFEQVDATFQKGGIEHTAAAQQHFESSHSPLAIALRDAISSASAVNTLSSELLDGQRRLLALAVAGANSEAPNPLVSQLSNGPLGGLHEKLEVPLDPTKELSRLIAERKYEEAFTAALQRSDVFIVSWLCSQVDIPGILSITPLPLSQGVLLSLLQQLSCDISKDTPRKLTWMRDILSAINPTDPMILVHVRPIFEQVYQVLNHHRNLPTTNGSEPANIRLIMHVINSMLMTTTK
ncbi:unnamed protein product [Fraxinus pennsylvanica]|uniref:Enhancer of mRNA-decapping protein 4 n=1 Tax=Fraxinus pennsylvanica TaxID=56036 RepID=A0AAD1YSC4_9LAMI|nr:unnamed protein product [Fraxinus pennsylvanica]